MFKHRGFSKCQRYLFNLLIWLPVAVSVAGVDQNQPLVPCKVAGSGDAIIVYDSLGGMVPRTSAEPLITINADGKVLLGDPYGKSRRIEAQMEPRKIQQLLDFIKDTNGFFEISADSIRQRIREAQNSSGRLFAIADAGESIIRVCSGAQLKQVKFYALSHAARQFPEIQALQQLSAIEQELRRAASWIRVGGDKGAHAVLAPVNQYLEQNHPGIEALTLADLGTAVTGTDGNLTVYFSRRGFGQQGAHMRNITVIADYPSALDSKPAITVNLE